MRHRLLIACILLTVFSGCARESSRAPASRILVPVYFYQGHSVGKESRPTGLHASDDGGKTFAAITWPELITNSVAVDASGRHYYLACGNGVMESHDGGRHWQLTGGWQTAEVQKIAIDRRDPTQAWAATAYGIFRRWNGHAADWVPLSHQKYFRYTTDVVQDLAEPDRWWVCSDTGLFSTEDFGVTWRPALEGVIVRRVIQDPADPARILAATDGRGLVESTDGGKTFERLFGPPDAVFCAAIDGDTVYVGGEESFTASIVAEGGLNAFRSWDGALPEGFFVYGILPDPAVPGRVLVCGNNGVLETRDEGKTFQRVGFEGALVQDLTLAPPVSGPAVPLPSRPGRPVQWPADGKIWDDFRPETDPAFDVRRAELTEALSSRDPNKWPGWHKATLAFVEGNGDEKLVEQLRAQLADPKHSMFTSLPLIGLYLHAGERLPEDVRERIREFMTTVPIYRGDTENHWVMHYAALLLAAQTWPETTPAEWYAGRTTLDLCKEARGWLFHWARLAATKGQGEFDSPNYYLMYVTPMQLLYDFAEDGEVKQLAGMMLDLLLADYFVESLDGAWCGGHSRIIGKEVEKTTTNRVAAYHWLYAGGIERPANIHPWLAFSALSSYRPPSEFMGIANDRSKPYVHFETKRLRNVLRFGAELNPTFVKQTYVTELYAMGSLPGGILQPIQQHTWDVTWKGSAENSTLFTVHPSVCARELAMFFPEEVRAITKTITAQKGVYGSPDKLISASPYERVVQDGNVLKARYRVPTGERYPHVTLYWPDCLKRSEEDGWWFGRDGEFFLALSCTVKGEWTQQDGWMRFRCPAGDATFVVVTKPTAEETFEKFRADVLAGKWPGDMDPPPPAIPVFHGPFLTSPEPGVIRMTDGKATRTLDFNKTSVWEDE